VNWDDMKLFLAVAREGSVSGGARILGIQHSTVSRRLRSMEKKLGARLLDRKQGGYELTAAGEKLQNTALRMEHEMLEMESQLEGKDTDLRGDLRVTVINNMATSVLMPLFASFSKQYPDIQLHIIVSNKYASLPQREADIAIRLTNTPNDTLIGRRLTTVASTIYGGRQYLDELQHKGEDPEWIGVTCCGFHQTWTKAACDRKQFSFVSDDTLLTKAALKQGLGISYLPCFMADEDPLLKRYCDPDPMLDLGLWILFHPDLKRTAKVLAFRDHMSREIETVRDLYEGRCYVVSPEKLVR